MKIKLMITALLYLTITPAFSPDAGIGKQLNNLQLKSTGDKVTVIPFFGEKVLAVFYGDPDSKDVNNPLSDAIKARKFPKEKYAGIGIVNCADTWLPNSVIRYVVKDKEKQYPGAVILIDEDKIVAKEWDLNDCNDASCFLIIGIDHKLKYVKRVKGQEESKRIIQEVLAILDTEIAKVN